MSMRWLLVGFAMASIGCSGDDDGAAAEGTGGTTGTGGATATGGSAGSPPAGLSSAAEVATKLGRPTNFLIGMGNDLSSDYDWNASGVHTLPVTLDLHYAYLVGLQGEGGWPDWNTDGWFPVLIAQADDSHGVVPMFSMWAMTAWGENNLAVLTDAGFMGPYWDGVKLLFQRLGTDFGKPAVVHIEPDFWAYAQQGSGGDPTSLAVTLHAECSSLPADLTGMGRCWVQLARTYAPDVVLGFHASEWASGSAAETGAFLTQIGAAQADVVVVETLDRDAGCFEAQAPECQRGGTFYWDETNQTSPNFHEHLSWASGISSAVGKPLLWWQMPFGVPSDTPGGTPAHYRDNRVKYLFEHPQEFADAGGVGACFGVGASNQTYITTDGGQFSTAVTAYYQNPVPLP
jgi:hypothetical protein